VTGSVIHRDGSSALPPARLSVKQQKVATPMEPKAYDTIEMGQTKLLFMPFCGEQFKWV